MRAARPKRVPMTGTARDPFERRDDFWDGRRGHDLAIRARTKQRSNASRSLAIFVQSSAMDPNGFALVGDSTEDDVDRRAQQHDSLEAVIDRALIRHAAG